VTAVTDGFDVSVVNLLAGVNSPQQLITGIELAYGSGFTTTMKNNLGLTGTDAIKRTINSDGTFSSSSISQSNWDLSKSYFGGGLALCASACGDFDPQGIIGAPKSTGKYDPSEFYGTDNNPVLFGSTSQPVTFHVYASGVTSSTSVASLISGANFVFGDNDCGTVVKVGTGYPVGPVPEPASIFLIGSGLLAVGRKLRIKK
jgi:hypothetical protein